MQQKDPVEKGHAAVWWGVGAFFSLACLVANLVNRAGDGLWELDDTFWVLVWAFLTSYCVLRAWKAVRH